MDKVKHKKVELPLTPKELMEKEISRQLTEKECEERIKKFEEKQARRKNLNVS